MNIAEAARAGEELPFTKRAQMRMDLGYAMARCREAVGLLLNVQGASAFAQFQSDPAGLARSGNGAAVTGCWPAKHRIYGRALVGNFEPLSPMV